jgi:phosphatidylinositol 4-kinase type 2
VFSQDSDFKERMFARQIAVMKGQAWNVVETLKQEGHGPLELTRRTRVCVWDDLVDIPVAIPLHVPSTEMQRRAADYDQEEEMDISAAAASEPGPQTDLLHFGSPPHELPNPNRFELSRDQNSTEISRAGAGSPGTIRSAEYGSLDGTGDISRDLANSWATLPPRPEANARSSRRGGHRKQRSLSNHRASNASIFGRDDLEGDLGYAAAQGMEGNERKVIVERLEAVKSRNPVFTWC